MLRPCDQCASTHHLGLLCYKEPENLGLFCYKNMRILGLLCYKKPNDLGLFCYKKTEKMIFKRLAYNNLAEWKNKASKKPLILRGARQVGKTTLVNDFASENYRQVISLNLERPAHRDFFSRFNDAKNLVDALCVSYNSSFSELKNTLLFIDEIQESTEAIAMLRFLYEDLPQLDVIAAGSLLEHVLSRVRSFPVGRVEYLYLHPFNFQEFLEAKAEHVALSHLNKIPVSRSAHYTLMALFHSYVIIGGMPEVVKSYIENGTLADLKTVYESIWQSYKDDVEKYASNDTQARVLRHIINTAHLYIDSRIKFENFGQSNYRSREVGEAMRSLDDARIIQLIYPTTDVEPPLKPDLRKSPKLHFLDVGLLNHELNIQADLLSMADLSNAWKGAIIPEIITQELLSLQTGSYKKPMFWTREKAQASAEVDLVLTRKNMAIPIEIKSGTVGKLKSLHQFIERTTHPYAVRIYGGEFSVEQHLTPLKKKPYLLMNLPYYLGTMIPVYLDYFTENFELK